MERSASHSEEECCFSSDDESSLLGQLFFQQPTDLNEDDEESTPDFSNAVINSRLDEGHLPLATSIISLLSEDFDSASHEGLKNYLKNQMTETQMIVISNIIKDLDRQQSSSLKDLSKLMSCFVHNLINTEVLSDTLLVSLLTHLGVNPENNQHWPLFLPRRTLSVMAQVLLLKQRREKDQLTSEGTTCLSIWMNLIRHLKKLILAEGEEGSQSEKHNVKQDLNVEHAQVLLYVFHDMKLLHRKQVLLTITQTIVEVSLLTQTKMTSLQIHFLGRLLHLFEYMMRNLYEAPQSLVEQIDHNVFKDIATTAKGSQKMSDRKNNKDSVPFKLFFHCKEVSDTSFDSEPKLMDIKPRFYYLFNVIDLSCMKESPKLDGMAVNFVLNQEGYNHLYESLLKLLLISNQLNRSPKLSNLGVCATQFTFKTVWRLMLQMPPSLQVLQDLVSVKELVPHPQRILHAIIWIPRMKNNKWFDNWIKDAFVKMAPGGTDIESIIQGVKSNVTTLDYSITLVKEYFKHIVNMFASNEESEEFTLTTLELFCLESLVLRTYSHIESFISSFESIDQHIDDDMITSSPETCSLIRELLTPAFEVTLLFYRVCKEHILKGMHSPIESAQVLEGGISLKSFQDACKTLMEVSNGKTGKSSCLAIGHLIPKQLKKSLDRWNSIPIDTNPLKNDLSSSEALIQGCLSYHYSNVLSSNDQDSSNSNLKHVTNTLVKFCEETFLHYMSIMPHNETVKSTVNESPVKVIIPLHLDASLESFSSYGNQVIQDIYNSTENEEFLSLVYLEGLNSSYKLLTDYSSFIDEKILIEVIKFMESLLSSPSGQTSLERFFCDSEDTKRDIVFLVVSASSDKATFKYSFRVLSFFSKLLQETEDNPDSIGLIRLCTSLSTMSSSESKKMLIDFFKKVLFQGKDWSSDVNEESHKVLQTLSYLIIKDSCPVDDSVALSFITALIPIGDEVLLSESKGFPELFSIMITLASVGGSSGHLRLLKAVTSSWLCCCKQYLSQKDVVEKMNLNSQGKHSSVLESVCLFLDYLHQVYGALSGKVDCLVHDSGNEYPSSEESVEDEEEESIDKKLCTFTQTGKEFMNQHWYHCHTCKMTERVGVCSVCALVCHKHHDVTYAKFGSFFCDCGAGLGCSALTERKAQEDDYRIDSDEDQMKSSNGRKGQSASSESQKRVDELAKQLEPSIPEIKEILKGVSEIVKSLLQYLTPSIVLNCKNKSSLGYFSRVSKGRKELHSLSTRLQSTESLMTPTLGSQEGAFEKSVYSSSEESLVAQLVSSNCISRVSMTAFPKRQHLLVSCEKNKITVLQLNSLLKSYSSPDSWKKLTLSRLSSAPLQFQSMSITSNPCNESVVSVCGLRECHVMSLCPRSGAVTGHIILNIRLDNQGNNIVKSRWIPGSQSDLTVVTTESVNIFYLSKSHREPEFIFLLPSGKVRDVTFVCNEKTRTILILSSTGHTYYQTLNEESNARHGPFYVTNVLIFSDLTESSNGIIAGGGVSIYYSHCLQLLLLSFNSGKTVISSLTEVEEGIQNAFYFEIRGSGSPSNFRSSSHSSCFILHEWNEIEGHPGLFLAKSRDNNPLVLMVTPNKILYQEIKSNKSKITDMIGVRHSNRTTLILLCEDNSLRIFVDSKDTDSGSNSSFWIKEDSKEDHSKSKSNKKRSKSVSAFFEDCSLMPETAIDFGGEDVLQIYNVNQVKHRLNTAGLYIANNKSSGFSLEVENNDVNSLIVGLRILVGGQDDSPSFIEVFGRKITLNQTSSRWYDIPFTRQEYNDKKVVIRFGPNRNGRVSMVHSVKVYGKAKTEEEVERKESKLSSLEHFLISSLLVLGDHYAVNSDESIDESLVTPYLNLHFSSSNIQQTIKSFLLTTLRSSGDYYDHVDESSLSHVMESLNQDELDGETFYRLLSIIKKIAVNRPTSLIKSIRSFTVAVDKENSPLAGSKSCTNLMTLTPSEASSKTLSLLLPATPQRSVSFSDNKAILTSGSSFIKHLCDVFWKLYNLMPANPYISSIPNLGLINLEATVNSLIEIIHALTLMDTSNLSLACQLYMKLLLCPNNTVSFGAKKTLNRLLKPRKGKSSLKSYKKEKTSQSSTKSEQMPIPSQESIEVFLNEDNQGEEDQVLEAVGGVPPEESLLPDHQFNPILDEVDDEAMVDFAIALSLQEEEGSASASNNPVGTCRLQSEYSDVTASPSDDEEDLNDDNRSTAATDGSTLRTSLISGLNEESVESGERSPVEGSIEPTMAVDAYLEEVRGRRDSHGGETIDKKLLFIRRFVINFLMDNMDAVREVGGVNCIPFFQVLLMLSTDLDESNPRDNEVFSRLLNSLLHELSSCNGSSMAVRTPVHEVKLIIMRLLSILMSRVKSVFDWSHVMDLCLSILVTLLSYWSSQEKESKEESNSLSNQMLKTSEETSSPPDMSPFFLKQYVKGHSADVLDLYPQLLSEMVLRLPYQINKSRILNTHSTMTNLSMSHSLWMDTLCEYMMMAYLTPYVKKQVRKLLSFICGSKEEYRQQRDLHALSSNVRDIKKIFEEGGNDRLEYNELLKLLFHLKACNEIANHRTDNWQKYCLKDKTLLKFFMTRSIFDEDTINPLILHLVNIAVTARDNTSKDVASKISNDLIKRFDEKKLRNFVRIFLLESNSTSLRWQSHSLLYNLYKNVGDKDRKFLLDIIYSLLPNISCYGRKIPQFVDLLGFMTLKTVIPPAKEVEYSEKIVSLLRDQHNILKKHPNFLIYSSLANIVEYQDYFLESCLICSNAEVKVSKQKLSSLKVDSRFTTTSQIVKLVSCQSIVSITLNISEIKRSKMVKSLRVYYNNRSDLSIVQLKNCNLWFKAGSKVNLSPGQSEVKLDFPLAILASNLKMDFCDLYDKSLNTEMTVLQCPRCSASVQASPGVCGNCGENVFQCHKCRVINYDERDPFLCNSCGFSKYAKFDWTITGRSSERVVDDIKTQEDANRIEPLIHNLLEKKDTLDDKINRDREALEGLFRQRYREQKITNQERIFSQSINSNINRTIQQIAYKYCVECKGSFEERNKIIMRLFYARKELLDYDRKQERGSLDVDSDDENALENSIVPGNCYGCASVTLDQSFLLVKALSSMNYFKEYSISSGLLLDLLDMNLGKQEIVELITSLTKDNLNATTQLTEFLVDKVRAALFNKMPSSIRHEMNILITITQRQDSCWEQGLRSVIKVFLLSNYEDPLVLDSITLPCLRLFVSIVASKGIKKAVKPADIKSWLKMEESFKSWKDYSLKDERLSLSEKSKLEVRAIFLKEKYGLKWIRKALKKQPHKICNNNWLGNLLFNPQSRSVRVMSSSLIAGLSDSHSRQVIDMLYSCLQNSKSLAYGAEFSSLLTQHLTPDWKYYLTKSGMIPTLGSLISNSIVEVSTKESEGTSLLMLVDLLSIMISDNPRLDNRTLIPFILNGYLSLRSLTVHRSKSLSSAQESLLQVLQDIQSSSQQLMTISFISALNQVKSSDLKTPVFIFEQLCNIIVPSEGDSDQEFLITLDKDAQQEDFLMGRMIGNPYSSKSLGPRMRDIKNKICTDCELLALLEDDSAMELLVNNKIVSLDLLVKDVFNNLCPDQDNMTIVYRIRGLMGDATEEFIESFNDKNDKEVDHEVVYKKADGMTEGGLEAMLDRLKLITDLTPRSRPLLFVILKLMGYCVKVRSCRQKLIQPELGAVSVMLPIVKKSLTLEPSHVAPAVSGQQNVIEQLLSIIEVICAEASRESKEICDAFIKSCGNKDDILFFLTTSVTPHFAKSNNNVLQLLMKVIPLLSIGDVGKMTAILDFFQPYLNFKKFDFEHTPEDEVLFESFTLLVNSIEHNDNSNRIKDLILSKSEIMVDALEYLSIHAPTVKSPLLATSSEWKEFTERPALKFVLRIMTGMSYGHSPSQLMISNDNNSIPVIHGLEQVSSDTHVGSLAETLLEGLKESETAAARIQEVRQETRDSKKKLAMAVRQKQLGILGMKTNERGQVTAETSSFKLEDLSEEDGLVCNICREGYKFQPKKVLGIYCFSQSAPLEVFEGLNMGKQASKQAIGYISLSHFNIVHIECHLSGVRHAIRGRDEWESAILQNGNQRCNALIPVYGSKVQESHFEKALKRHNTYLMEATGQRDITLITTIHDFKLLLIKFANEESFSHVSGGGARKSNLMTLPYLIHLALYGINSSRSREREERKVMTFLEEGIKTESAFVVEGINYITCLFLLVNDHNLWKKHRLDILKRLLHQSQVRSYLTLPSESPGGAAPWTAPTEQEEDGIVYSIYKSGLVFFALIDSLYAIMFKNVESDTFQDWSVSLSDFIRNNDQSLMDSADKILSFYEEEVLPCSSFAEFCDVLSLHEIPDPQDFFSNSILR